MADYYFSTRVDSDTTLCISPLTEKRIELSGEDIADRAGYFLYFTKGTDAPTQVEILAHITSDEAAFQLREMLGLE